MRPAGLIGLEHEFVVRDGDAVMDFRQLVRGLPLAGRTLDPGDVNAHRCAWGGVVTADGTEAEIAIPPLARKRGFTARLERGAARAHEALVRALPSSFQLVGYSTHLSFSMPTALNDAAARLFLTTFAPGLMLIADRATSPGLLVRPRPGRLELAFEYVSGPHLGAVTAYAAGAAIATADALRAGARPVLPPQVRAHAVATGDRFGWGLRRDAFGPDLLRGGRGTTLRRTNGRTITAQEHLEFAWRAARRALARDASPSDLAAADRIVSGRAPLAIEGPEEISARPARRMAWPTSAYGDAIRPRTRPGFTVEADMATWDTSVFAITGPWRAVFAAVPRPSLPRFLRALDRGELDQIIRTYLDARPSGRRLASWSDAVRPGLFDAVAPRHLLLAAETPTLGTSVRMDDDRFGKFIPGGRGDGPGGFIPFFPGLRWRPIPVSALISYVQQHRPAQIALIATTLIGAALGLQGASGAAPAQPSTPAPIASAAVATPQRTGPFDPCTLVTTTEAGAILEKPVTASGLPAPSLQCFYKPQTQAVFTFPHPECGASGSAIRIDEVDLTYSTGSDAASRYAAKNAQFGKDPQYDQRISGLGDQAVMTGTELSVLQGSAYLNVKPQGVIDCSGSGSTRFEDVYQKYVSILTSFARDALPRLPSAAASAPPSRAAQAPVVTAVASPQPNATGESSTGPNVGGALLGAVAGLLLGAFGVFGYAGTRTAAGFDGTQRDPADPAHPSEARPLPTTLPEIDDRLAQLRGLLADAEPPVGSPWRDMARAYRQGLASELAELQRTREQVARQVDQTQVEQPTLPPREVFTTEEQSAPVSPSTPPTPTTLDGVDARIAELRRKIWGDMEHSPQWIQTWEGEGIMTQDPYREELERLQNVRNAMTGQGVGQPDLPPGEAFTPEPKKPDLPTM